MHTKELEVFFIHIYVLQILSLKYFCYHSKLFESLLKFDLEVRNFVCRFLPNVDINLLIKPEGQLQDGVYR